MIRKKIKYIICSILVFLCILVCIAANYMVSYSLTPLSHNRDYDYMWNTQYERYPNTISWCDSIRSEGVLKDTFIVANDGARLHAFYLEATQPSTRTAVIVHGYGNNAITLMMFGYMYHHDLGFNILMPDLRFAGLSDGDAIQMGWKDRLDVLQWLPVAHHLFGNDTQIVVHGLSMGAATTMMLSGDDTPDYVKCFVEDCGYSSVWDQFVHNMRQQFNLPAFPVMYASSLLCQIKYGWNFQEASSVKQVTKCQKPMLFIHGADDDFVPTSMVYDVYNAKPEPKELWVVPGAIHARSYLVATDEYTQKIKLFTEKYLH